MKHATPVVGVYFERLGVGTGDRDTLIHDQFSEQQRNAVDKCIEVDRVAVIGGRDRLTQRARFAVVQVSDGYVAA
jgi:hypothetical protein